MIAQRENNDCHSILTGYNYNKLFFKTNLTALGASFQKPM